MTILRPIWGIWNFNSHLLDPIPVFLSNYKEVLVGNLSQRALEEGKHVHKQIVQSGCESDVYIGSSLIDMYVKCGSLEDATKVFSSMATHDVASWTAIIAGHVKSGQEQKALKLWQQMQVERSVFNNMTTRNVISWTNMIWGRVKCGHGQKALELSQQMQSEGVQPDHVTFVGLLSACASVGAFEEGKKIHKQIIQNGCESDVFVGSSLVDMYTKCGSLQDAQSVFDRMATRNSGYDADILVANGLVEMYAKCGSMEEAQRIFNNMTTHDVVAWNAMILGHVKCGQGQKALKFWQQMQDEGVQPAPVTYMGVLNACASVASVKQGRHVHKLIMQSGHEADVSISNSLIDMYVKCGSIADAQQVFNSMATRDVVSWNAMISLVNMYAKCGSIEDAQRVFNNMASHDVVSWTAMILAHVNCGQAWKALELSQQMQNQGVQPDHVTFVGMLNACADVLALEEGRHIHERIIQSGCESDAFVGSSLIDMYTKCGSIEDAQRVFNRMVTPDVIAWTAMLRGHAMHGRGREAIQHFEQMGQDGVEIDDVTFIALLSACNHSGLVEEGLHCFESMGSVYSIPATVKHYACMVDLLGRAGHLQEAQDLIKSGPGSAEDAAVWRSLLGACRIHGDVELGEKIAIRVIELDPGNDAAYVLLSNIYAAAGKWDLRAKVQQLRLDRAVEKQVGSTWIEVKNE
ncbi:unnamed protein product, partial [Sphagnum compactum]